MKRATTALSILLSITVLTACGGGSAAPQIEAVAPVPSPVSPAPVDTETGNSAPVITGFAPSAKENEIYRFTLTVSDPDGDPLSLSVSNLPSWLTFDSVTGELTGTPDESHLGLHGSIEIIATDGVSETRREFAINVAYDELEQAVRTGDHTYVQEENRILDGVLQTIEDDRTKYTSLKNQLFSLNDDGGTNANSLTNVSWDPTHDAALLKSRFGSNEAILTSNAVTNLSYVIQHRALGIVGETDSSRYAVFGSNPMRNDYRSDSALSEDMRQLVNNSLDWLATREPTAIEPLNVVIAQFGQSYYFPDQVAVRSWLDRQYGDRVNYNPALSCNGESLSTCLTAETDLLLISQRLFDGDDADLIASQVESAMRAGTAVMYLHYDGNHGELASKLFPLFNVDYHGDNYWRKLSIENYDASTGTSELPDDVIETKNLMNRFKAQSFTADLSLCNNTSCPGDHPYNHEFIGPVEALQGQLTALDEQGIRLFETRDYRYQKLLVLLGDYYRKHVRFPMDRDITATTLFLRSLFADHTAYLNRAINHPQSDMGNFSRSDFSHVTPTARRISTGSKQAFRATGAYALPGVSFTATRRDLNNVDTWVFVNTLRPGATHHFDQNGYSRPKYLQSSKYRLVPGQPLTLTSPYGGPIQIEYSDNGVIVDIEFDHIGEHPFWASDSDDTGFAAALEESNYDWAELITDSFEVHSTIEKMRETMANPRWRSASEVAAATTQYIHNYPHVLAGLRGPGIDVEPEIHDFAIANDLEIDTIDTVKHMNADQATCGYGCSGNPYDAYWSFDPLGHGDLHELGHGLERSRFRFNGWEAHASTNAYSYYSKYRYYANTGDTGVLDGCQSLPFASLFESVQASKRSDDPTAFMQDAELTGWSDGASIFLQLMMRVQDDDALVNGWNLLPRLHIVEREFSRADDDDDWLNKRDGLGFSGMTRLDARQLSNNDWLLIVLSHVTGRDLRDYLDMWGLTHSEAAASHVISMNLPSLPAALHLSDAKSYCLSLNQPPVPADGHQIWPFGT